MLRKENNIFFQIKLNLMNRKIFLVTTKCFFFQYNLVILGLGLIALYTENLKLS